jgi:hypothetical protein
MVRTSLWILCKVLKAWIKLVRSSTERASLSLNISHESSVAFEEFWLFQMQNLIPMRRCFSEPLQDIT